MKTLSVRSLGLFVLLWCALASSLAQGSSSGEHVRVAKYSYMPTSSNYLSPGGEVEVPWDWLSLPEERIMALTFDDGPEERDLEIANLLTKQGIEATFFFIGNKVDASPGVVKKVMGAGHEIGYHSYRHQKLSWISQTDLKEDFRLGKASLNTLGVPVVWFRPPYGLFNSRVVKTAKEQGMETILWTVDPKDWTGIGPETIAKRVIRTFHPGAVLLFHSNHAATLQALPEIIEAAKAREYRFVSLTEWRRTIQTVHCRMSKRHCPPNFAADVAKVGEASKKMSVGSAVTASVSTVGSRPTSSRHGPPVLHRRGRPKAPIPMVVPVTQKIDGSTPLPFM